MGGFILTCVFAWIMDRRQTAGKETFPKLRDQIADFAVEYIASESYRKNKDKEDEIGRPAYVSGEAACNKRWTSPPLWAADSMSASRPAAAP